MKNIWLKTFTVKGFLDGLQDGVSVSIPVDIAVEAVDERNAKEQVREYMEDQHNLLWSNWRGVIVDTPKTLEEQLKKAGYATLPGIE